MDVDFEEIAQLFDVVEYASKYSGKYGAIIKAATDRLNEIEAGLRSPDEPKAEKASTSAKVANGGAGAGASVGRRV